MAVRLIVALFHLLLASVTVTGFGALLLQARLNAAWERTFYGEVALMTELLVARSVLGLGFAIAEIVAALAFIRGGRASGHGMVLISMLLAWTAGWPLNLVLTVTAVAGLMEVWAHLPVPEPAEEEEED